MRALIMSADVAGGHDAAARAIARRLEASQPGAVIEIVNGLEAFGPATHRFVRDGYRFQIQSLSGSFGTMIRWASSKPMLVLVRRFAGWKGRRRTRAILRTFRPTVVLTTHPLPAMVLSELRRRGNLRVPVIETTTDPDPLPLLLCPHLDGLLVSTPMDVDRVRAIRPRLPVRAIAPPVAPAFRQVLSREEARERTDLAREQRPVMLVSGGSWAVGGIREIVDAAASDGDLRVLVLCAENDKLRDEIAAAYEPGHVDALGFRTDMPDLIAAADAVIHTGAGVTGFETLAVGTPLLIVNPIPGHGLRSAQALHEYGLAQLFDSVDELMHLVRDPQRLRTATATQIAAGRALYDSPDASDVIAATQPRRRRARRRVVGRRLVSFASVLILTIMVSGIAAESNNAFAHRIGTRTHKVSCIPFHLRPLSGHDRVLWFARSC